MAQFITAYQERMVPMDVNVVGTVLAEPITTGNRKAAILRGDFVVLTPANGTTPAKITKATTAQVTGKTATHIVALTDMTLAGGYVATDAKNYNSSELVAAQGASITAGTATKKVGLYPIFSWDDVVPDADGNDAV